jgi:S-formylglutathione hydrolase FrmB
MTIEYSSNEYSSNAINNIQDSQGLATLAQIQSRRSSDNMTWQVSQKNRGFGQGVSFYQYC